VAIGLYTRPKVDIQVGDEIRTLVAEVKFGVIMQWRTSLKRLLKVEKLKSW
jgi:hypothetical protein